MKWHIGALLLVLGAIGTATLLPRSDQLAEPELLALVHATVIDPASGQRHTDQTIVIADGRIAGIASSASARIPDGARTIDASGKFIIPGLWDMHAHGTLGDETGPAYRRRFVAYGVTGVRSMETDLAQADLNVRAEPEADPLRIGPRVVVSGRNVNGTGGRSRTSFTVNNPVQARAAVDSLAAAGSDLIKVYNLIPRDAYFEVMRAARERGLPVAGHVPFDVSVREAADSGQVSIEHLHGISLYCSRDEVRLRTALVTAFREGRAFPRNGRSMEDNIQAEAETSFDPPRCDSLYQHLAKSQAWQTPTLVLNERRATRNSEARPALERARHHVRGLYAAGARFLAGSDLPALGLQAGLGLHQELAALVAAGVAPLDALRAATLHPAQALGTADSMGTVEAGKVADLVVLDADPLADIRNTERISGVILRGRYLDQKRLAALKKDAVRARRWRAVLASLGW